mmetsp:Transcript_109448/g.349213  ORF Transcript_109448/g.349213 Transcript_109448/m.349213 type:complete len:507 (-) Transcript_109448:37-1557(-)
MPDLTTGGVSSFLRQASIRSMIVAPSRSNSVDNVSRQRVRFLSRDVDLSPELRREAQLLFSPRQRRRLDPPRRRNSAQEYRYGGNEAQPIEVMQVLNEPAADNTTDFTALPSDGQVSEKVPLPGERPWRSFRTGTQVILALWCVSSVWAFGHLFSRNGWHVRDDPDLVAEPSSASFAASEDLPLGRVLAGACAAAELAGAAAAPATALRLVSTGRAQLVFGIAGGPSCPARHVLGRLVRPPMALVDRGCGLQRPFEASAVACPEADALLSGRCLVLLLRRGGREVSLCHARRRGPQSLGLEHTAALRLAPGVPPLRHVALGWRHRRPSQAPAGRSGAPEDLMVLARAAGGALLALTPDLSLGAARGRLVPEFEVEPARASASEGPVAGDSAGGQLAMVGDTLLSLEPGGLGSGALSLAVAAAAAGSCPIAGARLLAARRPAPRLAAWDLARGGREERRLEAWDSTCEEPLAALDQLCAASVASGPQRSPSAEFLRQRSAEVTSAAA